MLVQIVCLAFNIYAMGLVAYVVCSWLKHPKAGAARDWLQQWYVPLLSPIRRAVKPVKLGGTLMDFAPLILLAVIVLTRKLVIGLLVLPF